MEAANPTNRTNTKHIAIQGCEGSFHHIASQQYFGKESKILACRTFKELTKKAEDKAISEGGVMAIENSIAGSILSNYELLQKSKLKITGEIYLKIEQHLLVINGTGLSDIREVHSHPMAFLQCDSFLEKFDWKQIEKPDTASSAKELGQSQLRSVGVIGSELAAELYGLVVLTSSIQSEKNNYTRFLVLESENNEIDIEACNKASVYFTTQNKSGSLAEVLSLIHAAAVNLTKIQSFPIPKRIWEYGFYVDMEFENVSQFNDAMHHIKFVVESLRIHGIYKRGVLPN